MDAIVPLPLKPIAYHVEMVHYLQAKEADLWRWFSAGRLRAEQSEAVRLDLLKSAYRIERDSNTPLYTAADEVAARFGLAAPITFYQAQNASGLNASLAYVPGEAHIVFTGPVCSTLSEAEVRSILAHELLHFCLLEHWPEYLTALQILAAMANDEAAELSHLASFRLFGLYAEVYCDRGAHLLTQDLNAAIGALVKIETCMTDVSAESYRRQTEEIFSKGHPRSRGITHPETFIRARALELWAGQSDVADGELARTIEGPMSFAELDLLGQERLSNLTRRLISALLRPGWMCTEATLAHAGLFFDGFRPSAIDDVDLAADLAGGDEAVQDYFCYVLLDFSVVDRDLEEASLAAALLLSNRLNLGDRFRQLALKELKLRKKQMESLEANAATIVARAGEVSE